MTPDQLQAFLDDLARLSLKHGIMISGPNAVFQLQPLPRDRAGGYAAEQSHVGVRAAIYPAGSRHRPMPPDFFSSIDVSELSNHERMKIMGSGE